MPRRSFAEARYMGIKVVFRGEIMTLVFNFFDYIQEIFLRAKKSLELIFIAAIAEAKFL
jgi:hypothetical protein